MNQVRYEHISDIMKYRKFKNFNQTLWVRIDFKFMIVLNIDAILLR